MRLLTLFAMLHMARGQVTCSSMTTAVECCRYAECGYDTSCKDVASVSSDKCPAHIPQDVADTVTVNAYYLRVGYPYNWNNDGYASASTGIASSDTYQVKIDKCYNNCAAQTTDYPGFMVQFSSTTCYCMTTDYDETDPALGAASGGWNSNSGYYSGAFDGVDTSGSGESSGAANAKCSTFTCPSGYTSKADAANIDCAGATCADGDRDTCCDSASGTTTCSSMTTAVECCRYAECGYDTSCKDVASVSSDKCPAHIPQDVADAVTVNAYYLRVGYPYNWNNNGYASASTGIASSDTYQVKIDKCYNNCAAQTTDYPGFMLQFSSTTCYCMTTDYDETDPALGAASGGWNSNSGYYSGAFDGVDTTQEATCTAEYTIVDTGTCESNGFINVADSAECQEAASSGLLISTPNGGDVTPGWITNGAVNNQYAYGCLAEYYGSGNQMYWHENSNAASTCDVKATRNCVCRKPCAATYTSDGTTYTIEDSTTDQYNSGQGGYLNAGNYGPKDVSGQCADKTSETCIFACAVKCFESQTNAQTIGAVTKDGECWCTTELLATSSASIVNANLGFIQTDVSKAPAQDSGAGGGGGGSTCASNTDQASCCAQEGCAFSNSDCIDAANLNGNADACADTGSAMYVQVLSGTCESNGYEDITDVTECETAGKDYVFTNFDNSPNGVWTGSVSNSGYPSHCIPVPNTVEYPYSTPHTFFNTHSNNNECDSSQYRACLCKNPAGSGGGGGGSTCASNTDQASCCAAEGCAFSNSDCIDAANLNGNADACTDTGSATYVQVLSGTCESNGYEDITDASECETAGKSYVYTNFDGSPNGVWSGSVSNSGYPSHCIPVPNTAEYYSLYTTPHTFFNTHSNNNECDSSQYRACLCKNSGGGGDAPADTATYTSDGTTYTIVDSTTDQYNSGQGGYLNAGNYGPKDVSGQCADKTSETCIFACAVKCFESQTNAQTIGAVTKDGECWCTTELLATSSASIVNANLGFIQTDVSKAPAQDSGAGGGGSTCPTHNGDKAACCAADGCAYAAGDDCIAEGDLAGNTDLCDVVDAPVSDVNFNYGFQTVEACVGSSITVKWQGTHNIQETTGPDCDSAKIGSPLDLNSPSTNEFLSAGYSVQFTNNELNAQAGKTRYFKCDTHCGASAARFEVTCPAATDPCNCPVPLDMKDVGVGTKVVCEDTSVTCTGDWIAYGGGCYHPTCKDTSCCSGGNADPCDPNPCLNGATCSGGECTCTEGYSGETCQVKAGAIFRRPDTKCSTAAKLCARKHKELKPNPWTIVCPDHLCTSDICCDSIAPTTCQNTIGINAQFCTRIGRVNNNDLSNTCAKYPCKPKECCSAPSRGCKTGNACNADDSFDQHVEDKCFTCHSRSTCTGKKCVCPSGYGGVKCDLRISQGARQDKIKAIRRANGGRLGQTPTESQKKQRQEEYKAFVEDIVRAKIAAGASVKDTIKENTLTIAKSDLPAQAAVVITRTPRIAAVPDNAEQDDDCHLGASATNCGMVDLKDDRDSNQQTIVNVGSDVGSWAVVVDDGNIVSKQTRTGTNTYDMQCWDPDADDWEATEQMSEGEVFECNGRAIYIGSQVGVCDETTCQNDGTCAASGNTFTCVCPIAWMGQLCDIPNNAGNNGNSSTCTEAFDKADKVSYQNLNCACRTTCE